ncbi:MAG: hypothetical protein R3234_06285 [Thermoanaerobaculia bacterium]|nr:hypothetical protein [Thermoanaerobaculia bacterium]
MAEARKETEAEAGRWWGVFELGEGSVGYWRIGPLDLWIRRRQREWRIAAERQAEEGREGWELALSAAEEEVPELEEVTRFATGATTPTLELAPILADRTLVTRPAIPLHLLPGQPVSLFVSSPLWIRIVAGGGSLPLTEVPTTRPPDTWFGPTTTEGELCYGSRTSARLQEEELPHRAHRAITEVRLRNPGSTDLLLERLGLPLPHLPLYWHRDRGFGTPRITVEQETPEELARVKIGDRAPFEEAELVSPARTAGPKNLLVRALGGLL